MAWTPSRTELRLDPPTTVPTASRTRVAISTVAPDPVSSSASTAAWTVAKPDLYSVDTFGVVTKTPSRVMWTGSVTVSHTLRVMPLPEYQRLLGSLFWTTTARTLGVTPSVWTTLLMSRPKPV